MNKSNYLHEKKEEKKQPNYLQKEIYSKKCSVSKSMNETKKYSSTMRVDQGSF